MTFRPRQRRPCPRLTRSALFCQPVDSCLPSSAASTRPRKTTTQSAVVGTAICACCAAPVGNYSIITASDHKTGRTSRAEREKREHGVSPSLRLFTSRRGCPAAPLSLSAFHGARAAGWLPCSALLAVPPQPLGRRRRLARLTVCCVGGGARRCECAVTAVTREAARRFSCVGAWMLDEAAVDGRVLALCGRPR